MAEQSETTELTPEELDSTAGETLPKREVMSIVPVSGDPGEWVIAPPPDAGAYPDDPGV